MRNIIGLVIGLYITAAIGVLGGGIYGFVTKQSSHSDACSRNWVPFVLIRAGLWPKAYWDNKDMDLGDWLIVNYDPSPAECG